MSTINNATYAPTTTKDAFMCFLPEHSYAGGAAIATTTQYAMIPLTASTQASAINMPKGSPTMPIEVALKEIYKPLNFGATNPVVLNKGIDYKDGTIPMYMQDVNFLQMALGKHNSVDFATPGSTTIAEMGDQLQSFMLHWYNKHEHFENYGCQIKELKIEAKEGDWVIQTATVIHSQSRWSGSFTTAFQTWATTQLAVQSTLGATNFKNPDSQAGTYFFPLHYGNIQIGLDWAAGDVVYDYYVKEFSLDIKNHMDEEDYNNNKYLNHPYRMMPVLKEREIDLEITVRVYDDTMTKSALLNYDPSKILPTAIQLAFNFGGAASTKTTLFIGNVSGVASGLYWKEFNFTEFPEHGFFEYKGTLSLANNVTLSLDTVI